MIVLHSLVLFSQYPNCRITVNSCYPHMCRFVKHRKECQTCAFRQPKEWSTSLDIIWCTETLQPETACRLLSFPLALVLSAGYVWGISSFFCVIYFFFIINTIIGWIRIVSSKWLILDYQRTFIQSTTFDRSRQLVSSYL